MHDYRKDYDLVLYGPDTKHGAKAKTGFKRYIWYIVWYENSGKRERSTGQSRFEDAQVFLQEEWLPSRVTVPNQALSLSQMEVNKALVLYATEHGPETSDPERVGYAVEALAPFWDGKTCGQVNTVNCKAYPVVFL